MSLLKDKVAIVTGGNGGIGLGIAEGLADQGATIIIASRNEEKNKDAIKKIKLSSKDSETFKLDVNDQDSINNLMKFTTEKYGKIDILVCNVGDGESALPGKENSSDLELMFTKNFLSAVNIIKESEKYLTKTKNFFSKLHPNVPIVITNHQTAEMIKYANNSFLATKISFINQIARICESIPGANVQDVALAIGIDPRIGNLFLEAGPGYGGSCLPKDVKAMIDFSKRIGVNPNLLSAVEETNMQQIQNVIKKIERILNNVRGKKIAVLGMSFKPFTDDVRDSVSIDVIKQFLSKGAKIKIHDPKAMQKTKDIFGNKIEYSKTIKDVLKDTECCLILTPWPEYKKISNQ